MIPDVEYMVLGQLSAFTGETRVKLGGKRQRLVLAVLLANANRVVSQDALLDAVWNGDLPEGGARTLHTYISILRKTLGESIDRDASGYVLEVAPDQLDAHIFEALVAEARPKSQLGLIQRGRDHSGELAAVLQFAGNPAFRVDRHSRHGPVVDRHQELRIGELVALLAEQISEQHRGCKHDAKNEQPDPPRRGTWRKRRRPPLLRRTALRRRTPMNTLP